MKSPFDGWSFWAIDQYANRQLELMRELAAKIDANEATEDEITWFNWYLIRHRLAVEAMRNRREEISGMKPIRREARSNDRR
jgi:hypothetical protein